MKDWRKLPSLENLTPPNWSRAATGCLGSLPVAAKEAKGGVGVGKGTDWGMKEKNRWLEVGKEERRRVIELCAREHAAIGAVDRLKEMERKRDLWISIGGFWLKEQAMASFRRSRKQRCGIFLQLLANGGQWTP